MLKLESLKKERVVYLLRINGKELGADQKEYLQKTFGLDLKIINRTLTPQNIFVYLNRIFCAIFRGKMIIAEIEAPLYILARLLQCRQELAIKFIRPVFRKDENGVQYFSHYEEIVSVIQESFGSRIRISFKTEPLDLK